MQNPGSTHPPGSFSFSDILSDYTLKSDQSTGCLRPLRPSAFTAFSLCGLCAAFSLYGLFSLYFLQPLRPSAFKAFSLYGLLNQTYSFELNLAVVVWCLD